MLVLSRKLGESILIGDDIRLEVVRLRGGRVGIGIEAPPEVAIRRSEVDAAGTEDSPPRVNKKAS